MPKPAMEWVDRNASRGIEVWPSGMLTRPGGGEGLTIMAWTYPTAYESDMFDIGDAALTDESVFFTVTDGGGTAARRQPQGTLA